MQKILLVALVSLLFFASCKNESQANAPAPENLAIPVKTESAQIPTPNPTETEHQVQEEVMPTEEIKEVENDKTPEQSVAVSLKKKKEAVKVTSPKNEKTSKKAPEKVPASKREKVETKPTTVVTAPEVKKETVIESSNLEEKPAVFQPPSHAVFDELLGKYVSSAGKVNYSGLKGEVGKLDAYLETLKKKAPQSDWSKKEKLAFWINAYNAFTLKLIVDNYPVSSITNLEGGKPWDKKWIKIGSQTYSLNNIENDVIRPRFNEPRIHFAVNCAAKSCPPLLNQAWTANNLEKNFEQQAKAFINNSNFNEISVSKVKVSKIFEWYGGDFDNLIDYLNKYSSTKINSNAKVEYKEYDWALNK